MIRTRAWRSLGGVVAAALLVSCGSSDAPVGVGGGGGAGGATGGAGGAGTTGGTTGSGGAAGSSGAAGARVDAGGCSELGMACTATCGAGFQCLQGACAPEGRPLCGGFAGAECPMTFPSCLPCSGCDYGVCLIEAEHACICATSSGKTAF